MILELVALLQIAAADPTPQLSAQDTIPQVTLGEALRAAARLDPGYVAALGEVQNAKWIKRQAQALFVIPAVSVSTSLTKADAPLFNVGTGGLADQIVTAQVDASYDLFLGGSKLYNFYRARAELESASANELSARFATALLTESDFYDVLAEKELVRVSSERAERAEEQLAVARARVISGAAVQTDSLQLLLELTRARVDQLRQEASLRVAQVQLGRRIGVAGPDYRRALADESAANAAFKAAHGAYLPQVSLFASYQGFGEEYIPDAFTRTVWGFRVSLPLWNDAQREVALSRAKTNRDIAQAVRRDTERAVQRDAIEAYQVYNTARASAELAQQAVTVARENLDVQETRYRAGATTILDLLSAQVSLSEAEAGLVQAVYATRLALAGLEAILGRRLFEDRGF
jgi:outer membrane protein TolC